MPGRIKLCYSFDSTAVAESRKVGYVNYNRWVVLITRTDLNSSVGSQSLCNFVGTFVLRGHQRQAYYKSRFIDSAATMQNTINLQRNIEGGNCSVSC